MPFVYLDRLPERRLPFSGQRAHSDKFPCEHFSQASPERIPSVDAGGCFRIFLRIDMVWADVAWKERALPTIAMEVSSVWEYAAVPVASAVMAARTLRNIYRGFRFGAPDAEIGTLM